jgi:long-chain acyl-CoA synthetase
MSQSSLEGVLRIPALLARAVRDWPERTALVCGARRVDYRRYAAEVWATARRLQACTVSGARIATLLGNSDLACVVTLALQCSGNQHVPLNPLYTARELEFILRDAQPALLIADAASISVAAPLAAALGIRLVAEDEARAWLEPGMDDAPLDDAEAQAPALLQYTGGTTGHPKGVILGRDAIATNVLQRELALPTRYGADSVLCAMPLFHSYGMAMGLFLAASAAATLVVLPRYRPDDVCDAVERERITLFPGSPTIYTGLLSHPRFGGTDWSSVRACYSGSAPLAEEVHRRWEAAVGAPIYEGYGQTEAGPILTYNGPAGTRHGSVGTPVARTEVQVVDLETGSVVLAPGQRG